jgi:hypothetical protein
MSTTTTPPAVSADIVDALRNLQTETDRWLLAEALHRQIPSGSDGFEVIIDAAKRAGVAALSANTLRLYRDTVIRWPASKRVANLSFSAHREAMVMSSIDEAHDVLVDLRNTLGADKVTVSAVRKAIAVKQGKTQAAKPGAAANTATSHQSQVRTMQDLMKGGSELIAGIHTQTPAAELDKLHAGLSKVIAHVERLRAKAARSNKTAAPAPKAAAKPTAAKPTVRKHVAGDLRGM